jgi:DNA-directed RNA polymerase specialized sigma24 family protein
MDQLPNDRRPGTPTEALMEAPPNAYPEESQEELEERMKLYVEPLNAALDELGERERYIVEQVSINGRSYRSVARELKLSVSTIHEMLHGRVNADGHEQRIEVGALAKLKQHLEQATELEGIFSGD